MDVFECLRGRFTMEWTVPAQTAAFRVVQEHIKTATKDVELFCRHAKRATVSQDDVRLLARHNTSILDRIC